MPTVSQLQIKLDKTERARRYAWAQYFNAKREQHETTIQRVRVLETSVPAMIQSELKEFYETLTKEIECPICLEVIPTNNLEWAKCGHKYCRGCITRLKEHPTPKCAICRKSL